VRKVLLIVGILVIVVLGVGFIGPRILTRTPKEPGPAVLGESSPYDQQEMTTVRGIVVPARWAELSFPIGGQLQELMVAAGTTVSAGQILARLETQELELEVALAQSELETQEAKLARLHEGGSETEINAAKASYEAAVAAYEQLQAGPSKEEQIIAEADLKKAETALQRAQAAYDAVSRLPNIGARPESVQLEQATIDYQRAKAAHDLAIAGPDEVSLKQAESQVASAKAQLEELANAQPSAIQAAQASVTRARINLQQAQLKFEQAALHAPFDGTVTSVADTHPGEMVQPGNTTVTLADLSRLHVETTELDEWSATNIPLTSVVNLLVPALGNRNLRGHLDFVASEPTLSPSGAVFYRAIVGLDEQDPRLRWGTSVRIRLYLPGTEGTDYR
jgi:HlyD family secretion protein